MDDEDDREASPEPSSSHIICENSVDSIDDYLSADGPSSGAIDSSQLFVSSFENEEYVENSQRAIENVSQFKLRDIDRDYGNFSEAAVAVHADHSTFTQERCTTSKNNNAEFDMEVDDNQPGSSSGKFPLVEDIQPNFQKEHRQESTSGFEATSNESRNESLYQNGYQALNSNKNLEANSSNSKASSSKDADSSFLGRYKGKGIGKNKGGKGSIKGKGKLLIKQSCGSNFGQKSIKFKENSTESSPHSLFSRKSSWSNASLSPIENIRVSYDENQSNLVDVNRERIYHRPPSPNVDLSSLRPSPNVFNEDEVFMVASSSEGLNSDNDILHLKSPTTPGDSCLVSSSTGQLDSLPATPMNFQENDISHSSPVSSPLNPPVLDSTVDSTSGQNLLSSSPYSDQNEEEIVQSNEEMNFSCSLVENENRNEISTSVSHLQQNEDSQDMNLLVESPAVFVQQRPNDSPHYMGPFISLDQLGTHTLHSTLSDERHEGNASALIPTSSEYLQDPLEMPGSSHMSDDSKRILYSRRKDSFRNPLSSSPSSLSQPVELVDNIGNLTFADDNALNACNSETLSHVSLMGLGISGIEPESSNLVASSANLDNEEFPSGSTDGPLSHSGNNFESSSTLAQLNQHYILDIEDSSLSSDDDLSPDSIPQTGPEINEGSLGLNDQLQEAQESLESESDCEDGSSNFQASLELGLGPQQLRGFTGSRQVPQSLVPPPHLLEEAHNIDSLNVNPGSCPDTNPNASAVTNGGSPASNQVSLIVESRVSGTEDAYIVMVSEAESLPESSFDSLDTLNEGEDGGKCSKIYNDRMLPNMGNVETRKINENHDKSSKSSSTPTKSFFNYSSDVSSLNPLSNFGKKSYLSNNEVHFTNGESSSSFTVSNPYGNSNTQVTTNSKNMRPVTSQLFSPLESSTITSSFGGLSDEPSGSKKDFSVRKLSLHVVEKQGNSVERRENGIPINIHSLFSHRSTIHKPFKMNKELNSNANLTFSNSSLNGMPQEKVEILIEHKQPHQLSGDEATNNDLLLGKDDQPTLKPCNIFDNGECSLHSNTNENEHQPPQDEYECLHVTNINAVVQNSTVPFMEEIEESSSPRSVDHSRDFSTENGEYSVTTGNGYWCADCERYLKSKCSVHRIQTIMDKPVQTRAWASLPAQHLTIKEIGADYNKNRYGVFARKYIHKRTQFGPLEGQFVTRPPPCYSLTFLSTQAQISGFIDISEEE